MEFYLDNPFMLVSRVAGETSGDYEKRRHAEMVKTRILFPRVVEDWNKVPSGVVFVDQGVDVAYFSFSERSSKSKKTPK